MLLPSEAEQISLIEQAEVEQASAFTLPQEAIDYILCGSNEVSQRKYRIYEQFQKQEGKQKNIKFLRDEYSAGGKSKGITISRDYSEPDRKVILTWAKAEKRIGELIAADRYLNRAEKEQYPAYQAQVQQRQARWTITNEFRSIIDDYVDFKTQLGEKEQCSEVLLAKRCADNFGAGEKKCYVLTKEGSFVLPTMREAMQTIIQGNTHLTERCEAMLAELNGPLAAPLEPTYGELNPPPPPKKEYRFSLGDTVYLGAQEYELLAFDEQTVRFFDSAFPLINKELPRDEFDRLLAENPLNDHLLQVVEESPAPVSEKADTALETAKRLINEYCAAIFEQEADFSNLHHVDLAFSSTSDSEHTIEVSADLVEFRLIYQVDGATVISLQCHDLDDLCGYLANLDFDEMIAYAEEQYHKQQEQGSQPQQEQGTDDFSDVNPAAVRAALSENGIVDGHVVDPDKLNTNPFIQQVMADVEQAAAEAPTPYERFSVIETDKGYVVWDDIRDEIYVDGEGVQEKFTSEWQAEDYLKQIRTGVADKEAAEWLAVERAKQGEPPQEPAEKETKSEKGVESSAKGHEQEDKAPTLAPPVPRRRAKVSPFVLHPEIPTADRHEYQITDDAIGAGTPGTRFNNNTRAICLLKKLESEDRLATPEEQKILAQYVGWGGLSDCFDERHSKYAELKALLTEDEYEAATESTLTAFYTPPVVIRSIYQALENMGFKTGNLLEPSCGIGNFIGMRPENLSDSKI